MNIIKRYSTQLTVAFTLLAPLASQAAFVVPPEIAEAGVNAGLVGVACLGVIVAIRAFHWIRRAL